MIQLITRPTYTKRISPFVNKNIIMVLTGQPRVGNNYPKYVVSLDEWTSGSSVDGIKHVHLGEFLKM